MFNVFHTAEQGLSPAIKRTGTCIWHGWHYCQNVIDPYTLACCCHRQALHDDVNVRLHQARADASGNTAWWHDHRAMRRPTRRGYHALRVRHHVVYVCTITLCVCVDSSSEISIEQYYMYMYPVIYFENSY